MKTKIKRTLVNSFKNCFVRMKKKINLTSNEYCQDDKVCTIDVEIF